MTKQEYQEAINWLFIQAPNYQNIGAKAYKPGLDNIRKLCDFFGNPQDKIKTIHVGGTNGKGSTTNMLASIMQEEGYKVGLFNSPHLVDFTERIKMNGKNADKEFVFQFIQKLKTLPSDIQPSFFEFTTIMAFEYFYQKQVDFAIIEVGLGGRLDSTNILQPLVTAITNVALDHQNLLGETIEEIATEKAGIIKPNIPVVSGAEVKEVVDVLKSTTEKVGTRFIDSTSINAQYDSDLKGNYQFKNRRVVLGIIDELRKQNISISEESIIKGFLNVQRNMGFYGRWFQFSENPLIICDSAHNQEGLEAVFTQLNSISKYKHVILGFAKDKRIDKVLQILPNNAEFYFVKPSVERGKSPKEYEEDLKKVKINYKIFESVQEGYLSAKQNVKEGEMIFIGGSNFVLGDFFEKNFAN